MKLASRVVAAAFLGGGRPEFNGMKYAYSHTITRQYMLAKRRVPDRESKQSC